MYKIVYFMCLLWFTANVYCDLPTIRQTTNGPVKGIELISSLGQKYYAFKSIPFAEPPITGTDPYTGEQVDRRFRAPEPLKRKWNETLKVQNYRHSCAAGLDPPIPNTSEDCLYLNIYVPADGREKKTVLEWIHGGGFAFDNASDSQFGPDFFLSLDNVVVTIEYRLGPFGFLSLGFGNYTGNMGLKDQQLAMKWVYENIEHFSGKKDEILLFGESAGGASTHLQMLNEESRMYFKRAIPISSAAISGYAVSDTDNIAEISECTKIHDMGKLVEYLKTANSDLIGKCYPFPNKGNYFLAWVPVVEKPDAYKPFITKTPYEIYASDKAPIMDAMFGFALTEYITFQPDLIEKKHPLITEDWEKTNIQLPFRGLEKSTHPNEYKQIVEILGKAYFSNATNGDEIGRANVNLMSDLRFSYSIVEAAVLQTISNGKSADKNTFIYRFSLDAGLNLGKAKHNKKYNGTGHADDLCYMFHCHVLDPLYDIHLKNKDVSYDAIMRMVKMITNFARTGNPSIEGDTPFEPCKSENKIFCQEISNESKTSVTTNIKEQLHYDDWHAAEEIYNQSVKY